MVFESLQIWVEGDFSPLILNLTEKNKNKLFSHHFFGNALAYQIYKLRFELLSFIAFSPSGPSLILKFQSYCFFNFPSEIFLDQQIKTTLVFQNEKSVHFEKKEIKFLSKIFVFFSQEFRKICSWGWMKISSKCHQFIFIN